MMQVSPTLRSNGRFRVRECHGRRWKVWPVEDEDLRRDWLSAMASASGLDLGGVERLVHLRGGEFRRGPAVDYKGLEVRGREAIRRDRNARQFILVRTGDTKLLAKVDYVVSWKPPAEAEIGRMELHDGRAYAFHTHIKKTVLRSKLRSFDYEWINAMLHLPHEGAAGAHANGTIVGASSVCVEKITLFPVMVSNHSTGGKLVPAHEIKGYHVLSRPVRVDDPTAEAVDDM